ncbi:MAG: hypothetical protein ACRC2S_15300 [Waterburya sp.]
MAERTLGLVPSLQPKLTSIYEPSQVFGDGSSSSSLSDSIDESGKALNASELMESNLIDISRSQTPLVTPERTNLAITRLSNNLSEGSFQTLIDQPTDLNSTVPEPGEGDVNLSSSSNNLVPSQASTAETSLIERRQRSEGRGFQGLECDSSRSPSRRQKDQLLGSEDPPVIEDHQIKDFDGGLKPKSLKGEENSNPLPSPFCHLPSRAKPDNSSELTPLDPPPLLPEESTKITTRSQPSFPSSINLFNNTINSTQSDSSNSLDPLSLSSKQISIKLVNNAQDLSPRINSSLTQPQKALEVPSAARNIVSQPALVNPIVTERLTQPLVNSDRALKETASLTPPLLTDDRAVGQTIRPLVPVTVGQSDRVVNSPSKQFQQRQEQTQFLPPPTIQVKIGRIEIRAVTNPPPPSRSRSTTSTPRLSLDDYLKSRGGG